MLITIDEDKCIGAGRCTIAADVFTQRDDDGIVILLEAHPGPEQYEAVREAAAACPATAIFVTED